MKKAIIIGMMLAMLVLSGCGVTSGITDSGSEKQQEVVQDDSVSVSNNVTSPTPCYRPFTTDYEIESVYFDDVAVTTSISEFWYGPVYPKVIVKVDAGNAGKTLSLAVNGEVINYVMGINIESYYVFTNDPNPGSTGTHVSANLTVVNMDITDGANYITLSIDGALIEDYLLTTLDVR